MPTNCDRAARFAALLPHDDDEHTNLIDLLADALHWCRRHNEDFEKALWLARMHFEAEVGEDD